MIDKEKQKKLMFNECLSLYLIKTQPNFVVFLTKMLVQG